MRLFQPTPRQTNFLVLLGCATLVYALYVRFFLIEAPAVESACAAGLPRAACGIRRILAELYRMEFFGGVALLAAAIQLWRPHLWAFTAGLVAALAGLVLYNTGPSALAVALLIMSFARPIPTSRLLPTRATPPQTTAPPSSRKSR